MSAISNDPKVARIKSLSMFSEASDDALELLARAADEVTIGPGHHLIRQDHPSGEAFVIERGQADIVVDGETVAEVGEGALIGELAFLDPGPATATVTSATEMTVLVLPHNRLDAICAENPAMLRTMAAELAQRLRRMDERHREDNRTIVSLSVEAVRRVSPPMLYAPPPPVA